MTLRSIAATMIILIVAFNAAAQKNKPLIDSLEKILPLRKDTARADVLSELAWQYRSIDRQKAVGYGQKAIELSRRIKYQKGLAQAYNDMGILYFDMEQYDSSILLYREALQIREQQKDDIGRARLYNKIGIVYQRRGDFSKALDNQLKALPLFEKAKDDIGVSYSLNNIGILNQNLGRNEEALEYHKRSVLIKQKINDKNGLVQSYVNMGNTYKLMLVYEAAEEYYNKALEMSRVLENKEYISNVLNNLGELHIRQKEYVKAVAAINESISLRKEMDDTKGTVSCLNNLATVFIELRKPDTAEALLAEAEQLGAEGVNTKPELMAVYQTYSRLYEITGDNHQSLDRYKRYAAIKDTLYNLEMSSKFAELETRYQTLEKDKQIQQQQLTLKQRLYELSQRDLSLSEADLQIAANELEIRAQEERILGQQLDAVKKEHAIQALSQDNQIKQLELRNQRLALNRRNITLFTVLALSVMGGLLSLSFYRRYKLSQEAKLREAVIYQEGLATKAVLEAEEKERRRIAGDLHDTVGQMMSAAKMNLSVLENEMVFTNAAQQAAYKKIVSLVDQSCKEVRTVSHNIMPNALLKSGLANGIRDFIDHIDTRILKIDLFMEGLDERMDTGIEMVLYRVVQECVNNVIKHAKASKLDICIIKDKEGVSLTIEDNGVGFDTAQKSKFEGIGLKNIITRLKYIKGIAEWSSRPGKGTLVEIHVPVLSRIVTPLKSG